MPIRRMPLETVFKLPHGKHCKGPVVGVWFGCGGDRDKGQTAAMALLLSVLADRVVIY